ncbi:MAG TPA: hypothetical protein V6C82_01595 [Chroococcales cyanobacterium]|jgi:hypothetical protein
MAGYKHYLPAASGAERRLLEDLASEHPSLLFVQPRRGKEEEQLFFEIKGPSLERFVFFLIASLRKKQRILKKLYEAPSAKNEKTAIH